MTRLINFLFTFRILSFFFIPILESIILSFSFLGIKRSKSVISFHERNFKKSSIVFLLLFGSFIFLLALLSQNIISFFVGFILSLSMLLPAITLLFEYIFCGIYNKGIIFPRHTISWNKIEKVFIEKDHINVIDKTNGSFFIDPNDANLGNIFNEIERHIR